jgi:methylated-DNA-protein-cysteine methyltransferase related protein
MLRSEAAFRTKEQVLLIVAAIPEGRFTTYGSIGEYLQVPARRVAYILATLSAEERVTVPWYRVVPESGAFSTVKRQSDGKAQAELLSTEGILIGGGNVKALVASAFVEAGKVNSGVPKEVPSAKHMKPAKIAHYAKASKRGA